MVRPLDSTQCECDECGRTVPGIKRVEQGHRYCATCYARCFRPQNCPGCGLLSRLLTKDPAALCRRCMGKRPCIRCKRSGRPVALQLPEGPVCNSCYVHFREPQRCSVCSQMAVRYGRKGEAHAVVCDRCAGSDHKTCGVCRKYRSCSQRDDGSWVCQKCASTSHTSCFLCKAPVAPGRNGHCEPCYWKRRCEVSRVQLAELFHHEPVRQAFSDYVLWAVAHTDAKRLCLAMKRHVDFFVILDRHPGAAWDGAFLLDVLGTSGLRRYELPMRWLQLTHQIEISQVAKLGNAEAHRSRQLLETLPPGSMARSMFQAFYDELHERVTAGKIKARTMRMALRPALSMLVAASPQGEVPPDQKALDSLLHKAPGQRAAASTFIGFLRSRYGIELVSRVQPARTHAATRSRLGTTLALLANTDKRDAKAMELWMLTALRYFHRLTKRQALEVRKNATAVGLDDGMELRVDDSVYWIPLPPHRGLDKELIWRKS